MVDTIPSKHLAYSKTNAAALQVYVKHRRFASANLLGRRARRESQGTPVQTMETLTRIRPPKSSRGPGADSRYDDEEEVCSYPDNAFLLVGSMLFSVCVYFRL